MIGHLGNRLHVASQTKRSISQGIHTSSQTKHAALRARCAASQTKHVAPQTKRLARALFGIVLVIGLLFACSVLPTSCRSTARGVQTAQEIVRASCGDTLQSDLSVLNYAASREACDTFLQEVHDVSCEKNVYVSSDGSVVGFSRETPAQQTFMALSESLKLKGWTAVESGSCVTGSFVKQAGEHRWLYLSCFEVVGQTSVVMQCMRKATSTEGGEDCK